MALDFIHLHLHSEYSLKDGLVRIDSLVEKAAKLGMPALALTDYMNLFAVIKFYQACESQGIKPIIGAELAIFNEQNPQQPHSLIALCQNDTGYQHLRLLLSKAYREGQQLGFAQVQKEWLYQWNEGLILLSDARMGDIAQALMADNLDAARELAKTWAEHFVNRFYLEVQRTNRSKEDIYLHHALQLAQDLSIPVVASNDVRFINESDFEAHEARVCIHQGFVLADPKRPKIYSDAQYLKSAQAMQELFADIPSALENSVEISKRCNVTLNFNQTFLPNFPIPENYSTESYLSHLSQEGLAKRLLHLYPELEQRKAQEDAYQQRLIIELDVINRMGFAGYFLIVADFIAWSKANGIPVGPGRGSGAGSLVAYALGITDLDPLQYDLLFERFLNPERVSMPDFDVDFCMEGRDRVIEYVADKYGRNSVSQIITFGSMAAKAVIRDVGRVLGHAYGYVDKIAKLIPFELGITLDKALAQEESLRTLYNQDEEVTLLIDLAKKLEGITRNAGKHAGGVVIAPSALTDFAALYCEPGSEQIVTQFDKDDVEAVGLVKFDFLGLRTLTIINWALQAINAVRAKNHEPEIDISLISVEDAKTYDLLKACETTAVFQLESRGMKDLVKRLQPDCFEDIIALVALFRPGPLQSGMVDDFIDRKHGRAAVDYPHPKLEPILKPTYGVILYQEQVMQIAQVLAGYTLGGADILRRAMGKKKPEEMAKQREIFTQGAVSNGVDKDVATYIFDLMEKFAGYGFNKSHSAAYALVAYQTAWLKAHYPAEFMAAVLSSDMDNTDKVVTFIDECQRMELNIIPPDVNTCFYKFTVREDGAILYGLGAIKGAGEAVIESLVQERDRAGPFENLFEFCQRMGGKKINKRVLEALIRSGAMDGFHPQRSVLFANIDKATQVAEQQAKNHALGQSDMFASNKMTEHEYLQVASWPEKLRLQGEKETLGIYLTGHPINQYQAELTQFTTGKIKDLQASFAQSVVIAGIVVAMRTMLTKRGDRMAFITLDDRSSRIEIAIFADTFTQCRDLLSKDEVLVIEGEVSLDDYTGGLRMSARKILTIHQARTLYAKNILIKAHEADFGQATLTHLQTTLNQAGKGPVPIIIDYAQAQTSARLELGDGFKVLPSDELLISLQQLFGEGNVFFEY